MKLAVKQPNDSMPNILAEDDEGIAGSSLGEGAAEGETEVEQSAAEEGEDVPMTVPADVSCVVPGCGRRHGRMCTFPVEGEMRTAWTSVLEAVFPDLDINAAEPKLKLLCEDHFEASDFDDRGLIQPAAVPTRFPGGVKVIYNSGGQEEEEDVKPPEPPITCCVPGCNKTGPADSMFAFPEDLHRAWASIISAATSKQNWKKGEMDPKTKRPLELRVCKDHFAPECFNKDKKTLLKSAHPSLFDGGKKKVILRPSAPATPASAKKTTTPTARKPYGPRSTTRPEAAKKNLGPVFVNVTDFGLQLVLKSGQTVPMSELTLSELRRISDCLKDKLRTDITSEEKRNLEKCLTQVTPALEQKEISELKNPESSPVMNDVMALNPDMRDPDIKRLVDNIKEVDKQRREYERSLSRYFEESDNFARESEGYTLRINGLKRKISAMETTFLRFFKYNDQRRALMGATKIKWGLPSLTMAKDIIQKVGKTAYARLLRMGFPLPSAAAVSESMEQAAEQGLEAGLVEVVEDRGDEEATAEQNGGEEAAATAEGSANEEDEGAPPAKKARTVPADASGDLNALQSITAEHLQNVLAGKGTLQDSRGRVIKVSLADVPGAPAGAKTVVMETPDDAGQVRYVPSASTTAA